MLDVLFKSFIVASSHCGSTWHTNPGMLGGSGTSQLTSKNLFYLFCLVYMILLILACAASK